MAAGGLPVDADGDAPSTDSWLLWQRRVRDSMAVLRRHRQSVSMKGARLLSSTSPGRSSASLHRNVALVSVVSNYCPMQSQNDYTHTHTSVSCHQTAEPFYN